MMLCKQILGLVYFAGFLGCSENPATQPDGLSSQVQSIHTTLKVHENSAFNTLTWTTVYFASWEHNAGTPYSNWGSLTTSDLDFTGITHLIYFAMNVGADGRPGESLDPKDRYNFTSDRFLEIVPAAHAQDVDILFSIGGAGNYNGFSRAISSGKSRSQLIRTILSLIQTYGFDGVDVDMEPIRDQDLLSYEQFVNELRFELDHIQTRRGKRPLLTAAVNGQFSLFGRLQHRFDQINLMTYDLSGPWSGWQAWHNSPLYSDGVTFESTGEQMPSVDLWIDYALDAGIRPEKLGIGIDFYGYIWHGVSKPGDRWSFFSPPALEDERGGTPYRSLYRRFDTHKALWDSLARVPYLSGVDSNIFVSFDNPKSIEEKVKYAAERGLGGIMVWELSAGYIQDHIRGDYHPLLQAVHTSSLRYRK